MAKATMVLVVLFLLGAMDLAGGQVSNDTATNPASVTEPPNNSVKAPAVKTNTTGDATTPPSTPPTTPPTTTPAHVTNPASVTEPPNTPVKDPSVKTNATEDATTPPTTPPTTTPAHDSSDSSADHVDITLTFIMTSLAATFVMKVMNF